MPRRCASFCQKMVGPAAKREAVAHLQTVMDLSERRACQIVGAAPKMVRYRSHRPPDTELRARLRDLANERRRFGYRRLFVLLQRVGEHSGIHRLYREERLCVRKRRAGARPSAHGPILVEARPNARWSIDFVHDQFANGRRFRVLNIVDDATKTCLGAIPDTSIPGRRVAREMTAIVERHGKPGMIVSDNSTEFTCNAMLAWCRGNNIDWHFIAPGKPMQNGFVESFNGRMRDIGSCLCAFKRRDPLLASIMPAATQRKAMPGLRQRLTLRVTRRMVPIMFSEMLIQASDRRSSLGSCKRTTVRISSRPSRMLVPTPDHCGSRRRARLRISFSALSASSSSQAWRSARRTAG